MIKLSQKQQIATAGVLLVIATLGYFAADNSDSEQSLVANIATATQTQTKTIVYADLYDSQVNDIVSQFVETNSADYQFSDDSAQADIVLDYELTEDSRLFWQTPLLPVIAGHTSIAEITLAGLTENPDSIDIGGRIYTHIVVADQYYLQVKDELGFSEKLVESVDSDEQVIDRVIAGDDVLGLLPLGELTVAVHPLKIDQQTVFTDPDSYPLQLKTYIHGGPTAELIEYQEKNLVAPQINEILAAAEIQMGRFVGVKINRSGNPAHSFDYLWETLSAPDLTLAHLESPLAPTTLTSEGMILVAKPETVAGLTKSGIDIMSISSNHFGDSLRGGMESTMSILEKNEIRYFGGGRNEAEAFDYEVVTVNNVRYGFVGFVTIPPPGYGAHQDTAGSAWIDPDSAADLTQVEESVKTARQNCDVLIATFHWGIEYTPNPNRSQIKLAHLAVDNGADIVVGSHPHVVQADEIYNGKYINYSSGNLIMDQLWSQETQEGVLLYFYTLGDRIVSIDLQPTQMVDYARSEVISKEDGLHILRRIEKASAAL